MNRESRDTIDKVKEIQEIVDKYILKTRDTKDKKHDSSQNDKEEKIFGSKNSLDSPFYEMAQSLNTKKENAGRDADFPTLRHVPNMLDDILKIVRDFEEKEFDLKFKYKDADRLDIFNNGLNELYDYIVEIEKETAEQAIKSLKRHISVAHSRKILYQISGVYVRYLDKKDETKRSKKSK